MKKISFYLIINLILILLGCLLDNNYGQNKETEIFNKLNQWISDEKEIDSVKNYLIQFDKLEFADSRMYFVHNSFAQYFISNDKQDISYYKNLLKFLSSDRLPILSKLTNSLNIYCEAKSSDKSIKSMQDYDKKLVFSDASLSERYRILLFNLDPIIQNEYLLDEVITNSKNYLASNNYDKNDRSLYRYFISHSYYLKSNLATKSADKNKALQFLELSSQFSPDAIDMKLPFKYFYEIHFLNGKEDYTPFFVEKLLINGDSTKALNSLAPKAIYDFNYIDKTKLLFEKLYPDSAFMNYWKERLHEQLPEAPSFSLNTLNGRKINSKDFLGKWIILDFWGTWCGPCRKEMPKVQKLSDKIKTDFSNKAVLFTVACKDKQNLVEKFMKDYKYDFTVLPSDITIEKEFNITNYPTKLLITPTGQYFEIYFWTNWEKIIEAYVFDDKLYGL
ncbi:MAG: TlpA disulfide reductase family protein [Ignavibacteriales bacterium]|nr:TlpA disulfide reductase family protein [Ignavibacteriales bacterium]